MSCDRTAARGPSGRSARLLRLLRAPIAPPRLSRSWSFAAALLVTLLVFLAQLAFVPLDMAPFLLVHVSVVLGAWIGGRAAGLTVVALTVLLANYLFIAPRWGLATSPRALGATAIYLVSGSVLALLCASFRDAALAFQKQRATYQEANERLALALEAGRSGSYDLDVKTDTNTWSIELLHLYGFRPAEFGGRYHDWLSCVLPEDREAVDAAIDRSIETGDFAAEFRIQRRDDGEVRWMHARGKVHFSGAGEPERMIGIHVDVTELKRAEEGLRQAHAELRDTNAKLEEADRRKNEFLAMLSHELRNPLAPIRNSLYVLDRAEPDCEQARRAKAVIERQVQQMTRLVSDLLDVSRISCGKIELQRTRVDLRDVVGSALEDHRSVFQDRSIEVRSELPAEEVWVDGDAARLGQALGNLLHNAVKFSHRGGTVSVCLRQRGQLAELAVRDSGVGIAPDMLVRVFQPFTQADMALDRSAGGLGLGLALVKGLVELHGGRVEAHSEGAEKGSVFTALLPTAAAPAPAAPPELEPVKAHARRVLVIEDNVDAAESLKEVLEIEDHEVAVAFNGPEGLEAARDFEPDIVLCDIGLPGMDGYDVARAFRADVQLRDIALVALTGYALAEDQKRAADAGFDRHLAKPPDFRSLEQVLAELPARHVAS
jgi:PAS domain S-box-containing protein